MEIVEKTFRPPTMLDVARLAGVGIGTVSRVVNDAPSVSTATARAVHEVISRTGYIPPAVGRKRGRRPNPSPELGADSNVILLMLGRRGLKWMLDFAPIYSYVFDGIERTVSARRSSLLVRQVRNRADLTAGGIGLTDRTRGIILFGDDEMAAEIPASLARVPVVKVMGSPRHLYTDHVQPDHSRIGSMAAEYLLSRGHRHCAYIGSKLGSPGYQVGFRADAFRWTIEDGGGKAEMLLDENVSQSRDMTNAPDEAVLSKLVDRLVALDPRPSALLVHADMYTPGIYRLLLQRGIRPQEDMVIVTCNNETPYLISLHPAPVVMDLQAQAIGRRAVEQMLWRAENPEEPAVRVLVEPRLMEPRLVSSHELPHGPMHA